MSRIWNNMPMTHDEDELEKAFKAGFLLGRNPTIGAFGKYERKFFIEYLEGYYYEGSFKKCRCK